MVLRKVPFCRETKRIILERQVWKCALCGTKTDILVYVRKDGNSFNNDIENCMAICPLCKKTSWT